MTFHLSSPFVFFPFIFIQGHSTDPVKVSVFYEALCPHSKDFFNTQLEPTYREVEDIMEIESYPYGFASEKQRPSGNGYFFSCHHGPNECKANKLLVCGKKYIKNYEFSLEFIFCIMKAKRPSDSGVKCSKQIGIRPDNIIKCANSTEGENLLHNIGLLQDQLEARISYVPFILINNKYSEKNSDYARIDLEKLVCEAYEGEAPEACRRNE